MARRIFMLTDYINWYNCYNLESTDTLSLYVLVYRPCNEDNVIVMALSPWGVSPLAASEEATPRRSRHSGLDYQSIGNNL